MDEHIQKTRTNENLIYTEPKVTINGLPFEGKIEKITFVPFAMSEELIEAKQALADAREKFYSMYIEVPCIYHNTSMTELCKDCFGKPGEANCDWRDAGARLALYKYLELLEGEWHDEMHTM